jgi:hypothetical protein
MGAATKSAVDPSVAIRTVTPEDAEKWLARNHDRNRKLRPGKLREYVADMKAGRWVLSDQAISFNAAGDLINGQHRLRAVWESGVSIQSLVLWDAPDRALYVIDGAMRRSTDDRFGMAGRPYPKGCGGTVRRLMIGMNQDRNAQSISDWRVDEFMAEHGNAVAFVHAATQKYKLTQAAIRAVLTRAKMRRVAGERIERFCEVLGTGIMGAGENAAVLLRNQILQMKQLGSGTGEARRKLYALTEAALAAFLEGERPTKLQPAKDELFPIAGDKAERQVWRDTTRGAAQVSTREAAEAREGESVTPAPRWTM